MEASLAFGMLFSMILGGVGIPLGIPPEKEDELLARVAPAECLFYTSWAGMAAPDGTSANSTEKLLADPEIRQAVAALEKLIDQMIDREGRGPGGGENEEAAMLREAIVWAKLAMTRPGAIYLESIMPGERGPQPQGGMLLKVGIADAPKLKAFLEKMEQMGRGPVEEVAIGNYKFHRLPTNPDAPAVLWGLVREYLVVGLGEGSIEKILERARGAAPAWHTEIAAKLPVARRATVSYINAAKLREFAKIAGPQAGEMIALLGAGNVTSITSITGLDAEGFVSRTLVGLDGKPQGLLTLVDGKPLTAADLAPIPADATFAVALRRDPMATLESLMGILRQMNPRAAERLEEDLAESELEVGVKWRAEILGSLGDVWRVYSSPADGAFVYPGLSLVVDVKDPQRLRAALNSVLDGFARDERRRVVSISKFAGQEIVTLLPPDREILVSPAFCVTNDKLIVALYPQAIKAYLSRDADFRGLDTVAAAGGMVNAGRPTLVVYHDAQQLVRAFYPLLQIGMAAMRNEMREVDLDPAMLPSCDALCRHLRPGVAMLSVRPEGIEWSSRQTLPGGSLGGTTPLLAGLMVPAVQVNYGAAQRVQGANNLKQIAIAMHNHEATYNKLPPAVRTDKAGKPLLSWRVAILPFIEQENLYRQFKLDEPWDSENNKRLIPLMPQIYRAPGSENAPDLGKTNYLTIRDPKSMFPGAEATQFAMVRDGLSNTVMAIEVSDEASVIWTKPDDYVPDVREPLKGIVGLHHGGFNAAMGDGAVRFISGALEDKVWKLLIERDDGQPIDEDAFAPPPRGGPRFGFGGAPPRPPRAQTDFPRDEPVPEPRPQRPGDGVDKKGEEAGPPRPGTAAQRQRGMNNLRQVGIAMHNYLDTYRTFPPAVKADAADKPLHSWRVLILPYIEEQALYREFKLDEPWDSEHNLKLVARMPAIYLAPSSRNRREDGKTNYLTIRAANSIFPGVKGTRIADVLDGTSNTVMVVEASDDAAVVWTKPDDFVPTDDAPLKGIPGLYRDGFNACFADGAVHYVRSNLDPKVWKLLYERADGNPIDFQQVEVPPPPPLFPGFNFGPGAAPKKAAPPPAEQRDAEFEAPEQERPRPRTETKKGAAIAPPRAVTLAPTRGRVIIDGKPLAGAKVMFVPLGESRPASAVTQPDGTYRLSTFGPGDGVQPGRYRVTIGGPKQAGAAVIPQRYADPESTELMVVVEVAPRQPFVNFDFELQSKP